MSPPAVWISHSVSFWRSPVEWVCCWSLVQRRTAWLSMLSSGKGFPQSKGPLSKVRIVGRLYGQDNSSVLWPLWPSTQFSNKRKLRPETGTAAVDSINILRFRVFQIWESTWPNPIDTLQILHGVGLLKTVDDCKHMMITPNLIVIHMQRSTACSSFCLWISNPFALVRAVLIWFEFVAVLPFMWTDINWIS